MQRETYCSGDILRCTIKVDVGYYEAGAKTYQAYLEPAVIFSIVQHVKIGEGREGPLSAIRFTIPLREAHVAENVAPEERPD